MKTLTCTIISYDFISNLTISMKEDTTIPQTANAYAEKFAENLDQLQTKIESLYLKFIESNPDTPYNLDEYETPEIQTLIQDFLTTYGLNPKQFHYGLSSFNSDDHGLLVEFHDQEFEDDIELDTLYGEFFTDPELYLSLTLN